MPKRNRHREAKNVGLLAPAPMKLGTPAAPASKPPPTGTHAPSVAETAGPEPVQKTAKKPKITTPPLTPEQRREKSRLKRKRNEAKHKLRRPEILAKLSQQWPAAFPADPTKPRPLAIGVHKEIEKRCPVTPSGRCGSPSGRSRTARRT